MSTSPDDSTAQSDSQLQLTTLDTDRIRSPNQNFRTLKRKYSGHEVTERAQPKRIKASHIDGYVTLLNQDIEHASFQKIDGHSHRYPLLQVGASVWASQEPDLFFQTLSRKGRFDNRVISDKVRTKSENEVRALLKILREGTYERELRAKRRKGLFDHSTIEAALEIGPQSEQILEDAADDLSKLLYLEEAAREKARHPRSWLLTHRLAKWVDECMEAGEEGAQVVLREVPAAHLLNIKHLLKLSKQYFMNSRDKCFNWRTYKHHGRISTRPSIFFTALADLHKLLVEKIRMLVQSALCFAYSRLHVLQQTQRPPERHVRRADVLGAIEAAGMETDKRAFWIFMPRRCRLQVVENVRHRTAWGKEYTYEEVEDILSSENSRGRYRSRSPSQAITTSGSDSPGSETESVFSPEPKSTDEQQSEGSGSDLSAESDDDCDNSSSSSQGYDIIEHSRIARKQQQQQIQQDDFMQVLDVQQSHAEEARLLTILGRDGSSSLDLDTEMTEKTLPPERTREDLRDWTKWTETASDWESFPRLPNLEAFQSHRQGLPLETHQMEGEAYSILGQRAASDDHDEGDDSEATGDDGTEP